MADTTPKKNPAAHLEQYKWQPGQSPNPAGRPKGSRNKLSESFLAAMSDDFEQHGVEVIEKVRIERPQDYLKIIASIVPKEFLVKEQSLEDMSDDELLEVLASVRSIIATSGRAPADSRVGKARGDKKARGQLN